LRTCNVAVRDDFSTEHRQDHPQKHVSGVKTPYQMKFWDVSVFHHCGFLSMSTDHVRVMHLKRRKFMDQLIRYIAQQLVDQPDEVLVSRVEGENTTVLELQVGKGDIGKVIGKQGRTAGAMRTILSAVSTKARKRTILEIIE
jgi:uncharacterized protein